MDGVCVGVGLGVAVEFCSLEMVAAGVGLPEFPQAEARTNKASGTINKITRGIELLSEKYRPLAPRSVIKGDLRLLLNFYRRWFKPEHVGHVEIEYN